MSRAFVLSGRGAPLIGLTAVLSLWVLGRAMIWSNPFSDVVLRETPRVARSEPVDPLPVSGRSAYGHALTIESDSRANVNSFGPVGHALAFTAMTTADVTSFLLPSQQRARLSQRHQSLWLAALRMQTSPAEPMVLASATTAVRPALPDQSHLQVRDRRWSADSWLFWREASHHQEATPSAPLYGANQMGGILRYKLGDAGSSAPQLAVRTYRALIEARESQLGLGVSTRPIASMPIRSHLEIQTAVHPADTEVRAAGFVTTELPAIELSDRVDAEVYAQAGYVSGTHASLFAQGQALVSRDLSEFRLDNLRVGAGAWAGAQRGAERIDIGPSIHVTAQLADTPVRLSLDWRERIAGDALPPSGIAATVSTHF